MEEAYYIIIEILYTKGNLREILDMDMGIMILLE